MLSLRTRDAVACARILAEHYGQPITTVLAGGYAAIEHGLGAYLGTQARELAARGLANEKRPTGEGFIAHLAQTIYDQAEAAREAAEAQEQDALVDRLFREQEAATARAEARHAQEQEQTS